MQKKKVYCKWSKSVCMRKKMGELIHKKNEANKEV